MHLTPNPKQNPNHNSYCKLLAKCTNSKLTLSHSPTSFSQTTVQQVKPGLGHCKLYHIFLESDGHRKGTCSCMLCWYQITRFERLQTALGSVRINNSSSMNLRGKNITDIFGNLSFICLCLSVVDCAYVLGFW